MNEPGFKLFAVTDAESLIQWMELKVNQSVNVSPAFHKVYSSVLQAVMRMQLSCVNDECAAGMATDMSST